MTGWLMANRESIASVQCRRGLCAVAGRGVAVTPIVSEATIARQSVRQRTSGGSDPIMQRRKLWVIGTRSDF